MSENFEPVKINHPDAIIHRYEQLKRKYFSRGANKRMDDEGVEMPNATDRAFLIQQFESMGCEVPMRPDQPFTPIQYERG